MAKRKRVGARASSSSAKTQDTCNSVEGIEGREKKRRKRSTSPNTDPVSIDKIDVIQYRIAVLSLISRSIRP